MIKKKILLIDDDKTYITLIRKFLTARNYEIAVAETGTEALRAVKTESPDLIILDVMLPKMDGFRVAQFIRLDEKSKNTPIIILSARVQEEDQKLGLTAGADAYLTKPFKIEALLEEIDKLLGV